MSERPRRTDLYPITGAAVATLTLAGCGGEMSTLAPAGQAAAEIAWMTWVMIAGTLFFMALMTGFWLHAVYRRSEELPKISSTAVLIAGGLALPLIVISLLLIYGVRSGHSMLPIGAPDLEIRVTGHQWFWEFEYETLDGESLTLVNELHLPKDRRIDFHIESADVIHGFWVPALGGKIDAIPGRVNSLRLVPTQTGEFGGQCAEFCGALHAHMRFEVTVHEPDDFERWLARAGQDAP